MNTSASFCEIFCLSLLSSGVFENAFAHPLVWLTALLATCLAILPAMAARALTVVLNVHDKHKVVLAIKIRAVKPFHLKKKVTLKSFHIHLTSSHPSFSVMFGKQSYAD